MKRVILCVLLVPLICGCRVAEYRTVLDEHLQQFRGDLLSFQNEAFSRLDTSFMTFYNRTHGAITKTVTEPYKLLYSNFTESCKKFPWFSLEPYAARRLINICDEVQRFARKVFPFPDNFMEKLYPNPHSLSAQTSLELMAEDYFANMNKHLEYVVPIYHQNPSCVTPLFATFLYIYKQPIDEMTKILEDRILKMFARLVGRNLRYMEQGARSLTEISDQMNSCSCDEVIDTYECVSLFIGYDCTRRWTLCGPVFSTMRRINSYLKRTFRFHEVPERMYSELAAVMRKTDNELLQWTNTLDNCLNISSNKTSS